MFAQLRPAVVLLVLLTIITGGIYPLLVTGVAQAVFSGAANGSMIERDGKAVGSKLIGQPFAAPKYFWSRASGTSPYPFNASSSGGTNLGPTNQALADAVAARIKALRDADPGNSAAVPVDLVTASGSGLDPHISPAAAEYQVGRVARARNLDPQRVRDLVARHTEDRQWMVFGEPRVNVLELDLALDAEH
jgi:potassium-transporting ATPase KdpC subunit